MFCCAQYTSCACVYIVLQNAENARNTGKEHIFPVLHSQHSAAFTIFSYVLPCSIMCMPFVPQPLWYFLSYKSTVDSTQVGFPQLQYSLIPDLNPPPALYYEYIPFVNKAQLCNSWYKKDAINRNESSLTPTLVPKRLFGDVLTQGFSHHQSESKENINIIAMHY